MFVFQAKKGKVLGKINSLSGIAAKTLEGKDKLSLQGQEENSLHFVDASDAGCVPYKGGKKSRNEEGKKNSGDKRED